MQRTANHHPVDQLAEARAEARELRQRMALLRSKILSGGCTPRGETHEAIVLTTAATVVRRRPARLIRIRKRGA